MSMSKPLMLVVDYGDGPEFALMGIYELAWLLERQHRGINVELHSVWALDRGGRPTQVRCCVEGASDFDENDWAHPVVKVTMPDGSVLEAGYRIDGRS